jgi:hypothetical protein
VSVESSGADPDQAPQPPPPLPSQPQAPQPRKPFIAAPQIFFPAAGLIGAFVLVTIIWPSRVEDVLTSLMDNVVGAFG